MSIEQLLAQAKEEAVPAGRFALVPLMPVIDTLRRKRFTWAKIHQWLQQHGETVHPDVNRFASAACQTYRRWLKSQLRPENIK